MSTVAKTARTFPWTSVLGVTLALTVFAVLVGPMGPLGGFWRPAPEAETPTGVQIPLFLVLAIAEGLTFGLGVAFLIFGYPLVRAIGPVSSGLTRAAHLSIAWLLANWWLHGSLHMHNGMDLAGLLVIDYAFHTTLMIAGVILAYFFVTLLRLDTSGSR